MYELIQAGERTYYIDCPSKIGIYKINDTDVCLIDSGNDKSAGRRVEKRLNEQGWNLKIIINTHSHADHVGGNNLLQERTGCKIYGAKTEVPFITDPFLEPSFLYGGSPCKELRNKFLMAQGSRAEVISRQVLPEGLEYVHLDGHASAMLGIKTSDDIWFLGDAVASQATLDKYHVSYLFHVESFLQSLDIVEQLQGRLFIPSHAQPVARITELVNTNRKKVFEITELLLTLTQTPTDFEEILKQVFDHYGLTMNFTQYALVGSTIRSYLTYLYDAEKVTTEVQENKLLWHKL